MTKSYSVKTLPESHLGHLHKPRHQNNGKGGCLAREWVFRAMITAGRAAPAFCISWEFVSTAVSGISSLTQEGQICPRLSWYSRVN